MKKFIFKSSIFITLVFTLSLGFLFLGIQNTQAQIDNFTPQVEIPGLGTDLSVGSKDKGMVRSTLLSEYIVGIYDYSFAIAGILAAIVLMGGGVLWLVSGGSPDKVGKAKKIIGSSLVGLGLLFGSYLILNTINPELLEMKTLSFSGVERETESTSIMGCCSCPESTVGGGFSAPLTIPGSCKYEAGLSAKKCEELCAPNKGVFKYNHTCGTGKDKATCIPMPIDTPYSAYEKKIDPNDWKFQSPSIRNQVDDMSPELAQLLNCMRANLPPGIGEISSISDSKNTGNLEICNQPGCSPTDCVHSCQSCHYGGSIINAGSYAVDFGDEGNYRHYYEAAKTCDPGSYVEDEGDHIHISASKCPKN